MGLVVPMMPMGHFVIETLPCVCDFVMCPRSLLCVGRHSQVRRRRSPSVVLTAVGLPAAVLLAAGADAQRPVVPDRAEPVVAEPVAEPVVEPAPVYGSSYANDPVDET